MRKVHPSSPGLSPFPFPPWLKMCPPCNVHGKLLLARDTRLNSSKGAAQLMIQGFHRYSRTHRGRTCGRPTLGKVRSNQAPRSLVSQATPPTSHAEGGTWETWAGRHGMGTGAPEGEKAQPVSRGSDAGRTSRGPVGSGPPSSLLLSALEGCSSCTYTSSLPGAGLKVRKRLTKQKVIAHLGSALSRTLYMLVIPTQQGGLPAFPFALALQEARSGPNKGSWRRVARREAMPWHRGVHVTLST